MMWLLKIAPVIRRKVQSPQVLRVSSSFIFFLAKKLGTALSAILHRELKLAKPGIENAASLTDTLSHSLTCLRRLLIPI